ncbi:hypothetical protein GGD41_001707 [Paraburkholderia bryophila]|uniref:Uncharacterized protein n=1 Tax=Paraburkholderia bryophila TaxID=420952 RepID=A0A7Z0AYF1_9BURK|nr:hypothetical protein [Paraburkholderia bryophila]NYH27185.1 hypothetical protein [Paraburkholderia bryophila]
MSKGGSPVESGGLRAEPAPLSQLFFSHFTFLRE